MSRSHLLNQDTVTAYRTAVAAGVDRVAARLAGQQRPFTGVAPDQLGPRIAAIDLDRPLPDTTTALDELEQVYLRDAVYFHHPRYLAHLNCPVVIPAVLAETVLAAINSSMDTWDQSAGGTLIERHLIDWTTRRVGLGEAADGVFTSGGTQSNLQAMLLAREEAVRLAEKRSPQQQRRAAVLPRLRILASTRSHFSVKKAAMLLGLDDDAVIPIPCDADQRMRPRQLALALDRCRDLDLLPMAVVATAGTTDFGSIDPLSEVAEVCEQFGVWFHVDAAYGCGLLVSRRRRERLAGIERADSVTVDYHKSFFQPVSSSAVLVRDRATLRHVTYYADYLNPVRSVSEGIPNQVDKSLQTTRRFDALKLWLTLRIMGPDGLGEIFDEVVDRAQDAWRLIDQDPRFEVLCRPELSTLVFRYAPAEARAGSPDRLDRANRYARQALAASGGAMIAGTVVDGRAYLKFTLLNPMTGVDDLRQVIDQIAAHAAGHWGATP